GRVVLLAAETLHVAGRLQLTEPVRPSSWDGWDDLSRSPSERQGAPAGVGDCRVSSRVTGCRRHGGPARAPARGLRWASTSPSTPSRRFWSAPSAPLPSASWRRTAPDGIATTYSRRRPGGRWVRWASWGCASPPPWEARTPIL